MSSSVLLFLVALLLSCSTMGNAARRLEVKISVAYPVVPELPNHDVPPHPGVPEVPKPEVPHPVVPELPKPEVPHPTVPEHEQPPKPESHYPEKP